MYIFVSEKAVLCEKALGINLVEVTKMFELAKENKVFLMEAIWSRAFPAYKRMRQLIKEGAIGEVLIDI